MCKKKFSKSFFIVCTVLFLAYGASNAVAASFDCAKAGTTLEKSICNNSQLNDADTQLGKVYSQLRKSLSKSEAEQLKKEQIAWLKKRTALCASDDVNCLLSVYESRVDELTSQLSGKSSSPKDRSSKETLHSSACYDKAKTQLDLNDCANLEYEMADKELNQVYQAVIQKHKEDKQFTSKLKEAQKAWIKYRDAEMEAIFPHNKESREYYGSIFPMCWSSHLARITRERTIQLRVWLDGVEEGDGCSGSYPFK